MQGCSQLQYKQILPPLCLSPSFILTASLSDRPAMIAQIPVWCSVGIWSCDRGWKANVIWKKKKKQKAKQRPSNQHSHHERFDEWTPCTLIDVYVCVLQSQKNHLLLSCCQGDLQLVRASIVIQPIMHHQEKQNGYRCNYSNKEMLRVCVCLCILTVFNGLCPWNIPSSFMTELIKLSLNRWKRLI